MQIDTEYNELQKRDVHDFIEKIEIERRKEAFKLNLETKKNIINRYPHQVKNVSKGSIVVHTSDPKAFLISQEKIVHLGGTPS